MYKYTREGVAKQKVIQVAWARYASENDAEVGQLGH